MTLNETIDLLFRYGFPIALIVWLGPDLKRFLRNLVTTQQEMLVELRAHRADDLREHAELRADVRGVHAAIGLETKIDDVVTRISANPPSTRGFNPLRHP